MVSEIAQAPDGAEAVRESHSLAQGAPGFNATAGDRQFRAARDGRRDAVAALLAAVPRPHHPVILGALVGVPVDAALAAAYLAVSGPASASVRLLGLDPLRVNAIVADLAPDITAVAQDAAVAREPADLPAPGSPGLDVLAEEHDRHHREEVRLFVS
jgi:urease accessory protein UreF